MFRELLHSVDDLVSFEGAWWILGLNSILLIPLVFAAFFFPAAVLTGLGVTLVLTIGTLALFRVVLARQHPRR